MKNLACVGVVVLGLVTACSAEDTTPPTVSATTVTVSSNAFDPATVTIKAGETVTWKWAGGTHNVVSGTNCTSDGKFTSGDPVAGATFDHRFDTPGTYDYFCAPHCGMAMVGQVIVQ